MDSEPRDTVQTDPPPSSEWHAEPPISSGTPSARLSLKRLIHDCPGFHILAAPVVRAIAGLVVSNYVVELFVKLSCLRPSFLWSLWLCIFCYFKWGLPNVWLAHNSLSHRVSNDRFNPLALPFEMNCIWCLVPVLYISNYLLQSDLLYSSVWCSEPQHQLRTCHFNNLYYDTLHGFLFLLDESSVISGIHDFEEFKNLKLSPIADHTGVNMQITMIRSSDASSLSFKFSKSFLFAFTEFIEEPHFLLYRFKPDNFMHVVHDDLLPLFFKFREISMGKVSRVVAATNLFFADLNDHGPFAEWYQALSSATPLLAKGMSAKKVYCFSSLYMGASNTSFFQYGFNKPQGPIGPNLNGRDIEEFKRYYMEYFDVEPDRSNGMLKVTLISRKINRKIINEDEIVRTLLKMVNEDGFYKGKILVVAKGDMFADKNELLDLVVSSDIVIGMHGAETILSLFLPESSIFIEMFPFGISKDNVSPIYSLSKAKGVHFRYLSWDNTEERNSIVHPEYPKEFGGTEGYPSDLTTRIYSTKRVPAVPCCNNPFYLFRMYQDTIVDDSFSEVASTALKWLKLKKPVVTAETQWFFPGPVVDLTCHRHTNYVHVLWGTPHNVVGQLRSQYDIFVQADTVHRSVFINESEVRFDLGEEFRAIQVWVSSEVDGKKSIDSFCNCQFMKNELNRHPP